MQIKIGYCSFDNRSLIRLLLSVCYLTGFGNGISAQSQHDRIWILGYESSGGSNPNTGFGGTVIDFRQEPPTLSYQAIPFGLMDGNSQICNANGALQFYTNGCRILGHPAYEMANGDGLNPGTVHDDDCQKNDNNSYKGFQSIITLPWPGRADYYAVIHLGMIDTVFWDQAPITGKIYIDKVYLTEVDMHANNGLGEAGPKNQILLQDTLNQNTLAVRHGNGRDWWVVVPKEHSNVFFIFLLDPTGMRFVKKQSIGLASGSWGDVAKFSQDGTRYARVSKRNGIDLFDFDRCSGSFSCPKRLPYPTEYEDYLYSGISFSPNSRFLYVSSLLELNQYDLWAKDVNASKVLVGKYEQGDGPFADLFMQQLAPDGKIYISSTNGSPHLHVIRRPDALGTACDFGKKAFPLLTRNGSCLPNYPNFNLYDLPASPCDSLGIDAPEGYESYWSPSDTFKIFPNPVLSRAWLSLPKGCIRGERVEIYSTLGVFIKEYPVISVHQNIEIDCSDLPAGVYFVSMKVPEHKRPLIGKLVKV